VRATTLAATVLLAGCTANTLPKPTPAVMGHITYRERVALPPDAEVRVVLLDVSRQDAEATPVADTTIRPDGRQVPLPFVLRYDPKRIDPRHEYAVRATITSGGQPTFTTPAVVKVITGDHPSSVSLMVSPVQSAGAAAPSSLAGIWVLEDVAGAGVIDNARATLEFREPGRVSGRGSCNQFSGPVTIGGSTISFGALAVTKMACPEAVMNQETSYFKALQAAERYSVEGTTLLIYAKGLDKPLRFTRGGP